MHLIFLNKHIFELNDKCKYYISTLGLEEMLILLLWFGVGGLEANSLYCLCKGSKFLFT